MSNVAVIFVIGAGTYLLRLSFIGIVGDRIMPNWALVPLRFVAPAVLAALIAPAVLLKDGALDLSPGSNPRAMRHTWVSMGSLTGRCHWNAEQHNRPWSRSSCGIWSQRPDSSQQYAYSVAGCEATTIPPPSGSSRI